MATEEKGGAGGKFRKRPFRRNQTTPYDRPTTSLRNPNGIDGWLSKLVDPAQRLIAYSAHSLFSSLFRKRLLPPPSSSETEQGVRNDHQEEAATVANNSSGKQQGTVGESDTQINCSDGGGLTELEKLLKQKTFTRSEIDHLTALLHSRTVDAPFREEKKGTEMVPSESMFPGERKDGYPKTPALENGIENHLVVAPHVTSSFPIEDVASPAELAKAYMGSRPSKVSSSISGVQTLVLREHPTPIKSENFPLKSPIMSIVPRATRHAAVHENGFLTPRSRSRSAIYSMARTPYSRVYPTSTLKSSGPAVEVEPSSSQSALDHDMLSGSKQEAVKRRSSVLDNDMGSVGPIRRIRQKSNLLYTKGSSLPLSGSSLTVARSGVGTDTTQQTSSSMQKPILLDDVKRSHVKLSEENVDDTKPSLNFPPLHSKSCEMASKILQQLDKLVSPKEKSSELRVPIANDKTPKKFSPSMLHGQALQSLERVDTSKLLDDIQGNKLDALGNLSATSHKQKLNSDRNEVEKGPLKLVPPSNGLSPTDVTNPRNQVLSSAKSVSNPPQKKAFHMSAHEDCLDLDDDTYPNGAVSSFSPVENVMTSSPAVKDKTTSSTEAIAPENPSALSVVMAPKNSTIVVEACVSASDECRVGEKVDASTCLTSSILDPTFKTVTAAAQTSFGSDQPPLPNGSIANPPLFNFGNKVVSSSELTAGGALSKEITKSGPVFGFGKVVPSKESIGDAPVVNYGSNKNVDKVPPMPFTASSSVFGESTFLKFGTSSDTKLGSSISSTTVAVATDSVPNVHESDNGATKTDIVAGSSVKASEPAVSSTASTSSKSIFAFGHSSKQNNGSLLSSPSLSSSFPSLISNNLTSQNIFSNSFAATSSAFNTTADSTGTATTLPAIIASSNNSSSTPVVTSSSSSSLFKFGSSPAPSTGLPVSSSVSEPLETKMSQDTGMGNHSSTTFGSSSGGSGIFGFSSSAVTTVNSQSQCSVISASSGSVLGAHASSVTGGVATSTQIQSVAFGLSVSSPSFGLTGNTAFSSGNTLFPSSPATDTAFSSGTSLFPSSCPTTNVLNSGTTFGLSTSASSSAANSINTNSGISSTLFGSTSSSSSSSGFVFGASTASVTSASSATILSSTSNASSPQFSFTSAASTSTQPAFGSPNPVFTFGSAPVNNDQMSMEDSMLEDTVQATSPATSIFGQQPAPVQSNFAFGASTLSGASPFQFGSQQNIAPQNPSPFQASGSLEFNAGGSFSLGTGGGDKSGRKILKIKHKPRKK